MVIRVKKKGLMVYFYRTGRIFTPDRQGTGKNQLSVEGVGAPIRKTSYNFVFSLISSIQGMAYTFT